MPGFSGFNQHIETTIWLGFDNNQRSLHEYASSSALPIWIDYMRTVLKDYSYNADRYTARYCKCSY